MWFGAKTSDEELKVALDEINATQAILLDVREQKEWDEKRFAQAKLVPTTTINGLPPDAREIPNVAKTTRVYVHCEKGVRAKHISKLMCKMGYDAIPLACSFDHMAEQGFQLG